ncbi:Bug family tripartite tricarboxylate transporter substrate binding protein [Pararhizobium haloflavum]|uniref:Bug family tripartite tricarboxylate transporter substrate binding protein n=1 Tax=Pararhizobium haloflavum TaxID=2037914 RepID=UPI000C1A5DF6|nr:tripartite tricarboxylate transporter substrate-binding protein [Pararhizobium haloflavum]
MSLGSRIIGASIIASSLFALPAFAEECIAPADPGGGWDFTCRTAGKLLYDLQLVDEPVQVTNMPGGVGAVAWANVASRRADDASLIVATSTVGITEIAQGRYPSDASAMRWIGMLGTDVGVVVVPADSEYETLDQLVEQLNQDPASIAAAGSSGAGGWDHIRLLMLAEAGGLSSEEYQQIRWVQFDGGSPAVTQMLGGQVDVVTTDLGEIAGFVESGDIRILAAMSDEPIPAFPDAPTAIDQGYEVTGYNWRGFYTGGDVSDEAYDEWVATLEELYNTDEWKEAAESSGLIPVWRGGEEFETYVNEQAEQMAEISRQIGVIE